MYGEADIYIYMYSSFLTLAVDGGEQLHVSADLPPRNSLAVPIGIKYYYDGQMM
jgi:hypothetical protein